MRRPALFLNAAASLSTFDVEANFVQPYRGTTIWKLPADLHRYSAAIRAARPAVVVELGTKWGGFACWLADNLDVEVITVDVERAEGRPDTWPNVTFVEGDSTATATVAEVARLAAGRRTMVSLDSDHHAPHVAREIALYGPLVSPGCHLVIEDGIADLAPRPARKRWGRRVPTVGGPLRAISQTVFNDPAWERDEAVERLSMITHSPAGWWRRRG